MELTDKSLDRQPSWLADEKLANGDNAAGIYLLQVNNKH